MPNRMCPDCGTTCQCPSDTCETVSPLRKRLISLRPFLAPVIDKLKDTHLAQLGVAFRADADRTLALRLQREAYELTLHGEAAAHHGAGVAILNTSAGARTVKRVVAREARKLSREEKKKQLLEGVAHIFESMENA